jgi:hypothetical protein
MSADSLCKILGMGAVEGDCLGLCTRRAEVLFRATSNNCSQLDSVF